MRKIFYLIAFLTLIIFINGCSGYKPIFASPDLGFEIADYKIKGNKNLGRKIYFRLYKLSKLNKNNTNTQSVYIIIETTKNNEPIAKNSAGKVLEYRVSLDTNVTIKDFISNKEILNHNLSFSSSYKAQDQYSETIKLEKQNVENLLNKTYQDLLIKVTEKKLRK